MKTAVIICEFNPLHDGHAYIVEKARQLTDADFVLCIMSGSCVQRGELAVLDKYTRAVHAINAGADSVVELPAQYTLASAKEFAAGAIKIANTVKGEKFLCFGSECGDVGLLTKAAKLISDGSLDENVKQLVSEGIGYPAALSQAVSEFLDKDVLSTPNNVLGIEYIRAIAHTGADITPVTVKREKQLLLPDKTKYFMSSREIREAVKCGKSAGLPLPPYVKSDLTKACVCDDRLFAVAKYMFSSVDVSGIYDDAEGLSNRIANTLKECADLDEFMYKVNTKRYTNARIKRLLMNSLLLNRYTHSDLQNAKTLFANVLAVKNDKKDILSLFDTPLTFNAKDRIAFSEQYALTKRADNLFASCRYRFGERTVFV